MTRGHHESKQFTPLALSDSFKMYYSQLRDPSQPNPTTALHTFALNGDASHAEYYLLLKKGADVNVADNTGCTALHHAALLGRVTICALLIDHEANVNALTVDDNTPLHKAAQSGYIAVIKLLLDAGADRRAVNRVRLVVNSSTAVCACARG